MNWISEHLQLILAIAGAFAYWLNQRREAAAAKEEEAKNPTPASMAEAEVEDSYRAEQVREEIRRKIAERRGGAPIPEPAFERNEPPVFEEKRFQLPPIGRTLEPIDTFGGPSRPLVRRAESVRPIEPPVIVASETLEASLQRQEQLATKLRELTEQRAMVARKAAAVAVTDAAAVESAREGTELRHDLRDARSLRRAMVLREVLGTPVGLR
jgi:hypothetical protein